MSSTSLLIYPLVSFYSLRFLFFISFPPSFHFLFFAVLTQCYLLLPTFMQWLPLGAFWRLCSLSSFFIHQSQFFSPVHCLAPLYPPSPSLCFYLIPLSHNRSYQSIPFPKTPYHHFFHLIHFIFSLTPFLLSASEAKDALCLISAVTAWPDTL